MRIWKLVPSIADSEDWALSSYRGEVVVVRAKDEQEARILAAKRFGAAAPRKSGQSTRLNPWENSTLVSCEAIQAHDYQENGPSTILEPRHC